MAITIQQFRKAIDSLELTHRFYEPGSFLFSLEDDDISKGFIFSVIEEKSYIQATALVSNVFFDEAKIVQAYKICNDWNDKRNFPKAYIRRDDEDNTLQIMCEWQWDSEPEFTEEQIKELIIASFAASSAMFFKEVAESGLYNE